MKPARFTTAPWSHGDHNPFGTYNYAVLDITLCTNPDKITCCCVCANAKHPTGYPGLCAMVDSREHAEQIAEYLNTLYPTGTKEELAYNACGANRNALAINGTKCGDIFTGSELMSEISEYLTNLEQFNRRAP